MEYVAMIGLLFAPIVCLLCAAWFYVRWKNEHEDQELALRDMDDPPITPENYDEIMARMETYLGEFEQHGTDNITVDMEE